MHFLNQLNPLPPIPAMENKSLKKVLKAPTEEEKVKEDIKWINAFFKEYGREPCFDRTNYPEYGLCEKLQRLRFNFEAYPFLKELDVYNLLTVRPEHNKCKSPQGQRGK